VDDDDDDDDDDDNNKNNNNIKRSPSLRAATRQSLRETTLVDSEPQ